MSGTAARSSCAPEIDSALSVFLRKVEFWFRPVTRMVSTPPGGGVAGAGADAGADAGAGVAVAGAGSAAIAAFEWDHAATARMEHAHAMGSGLNENGCVRPEAMSFPLRVRLFKIRLPVQ
jgi:hypothetical protein